LTIRQIEDEEYDLWILISRVYHVIAKLRKVELSKYSIAPTQSYILLIIKALGNQTTPTELSRYVYQERSSVSDILNRMEKQGLIVKTKKSGERKRVIVTITEKGEESLRLSRNRECLHKVMSSLTDEERQQLVSCLEILRDNAINELNIHEKQILPPSRISEYYHKKGSL